MPAGATVAVTVGLPRSTYEVPSVWSYTLSPEAYLEKKESKCHPMNNLMAYVTML